jgi:hypothetical protein
MFIYYIENNKKYYLCYDSEYRTWDEINQLRMDGWFKTQISFVDVLACHCVIAREESSLGKKLHFIDMN